MDEKDKKGQPDTKAPTATPVGTDPGASAPLVPPQPTATERKQVGLGDPIRVAMDMPAPAISIEPTIPKETKDKVLWLVIRNRTNAISFTGYQRFINDVMCGNVDGLCDSAGHDYFRGLGAYECLKQASELYLMSQCGVMRMVDKGGESVEQLNYEPALTTEADAQRLNWTKDYADTNAEDLYARYQDKLIGPAGTTEGLAIPYLALIRSAFRDVPLKGGPNEKVRNCYGLLRDRLISPCMLELIWSYWHEEGMLVQTLNAVCMRFQNRRTNGATDGLRRFDLNPLRPLSNLLWGYMQDEQHRLTVARRAYEYDHQYGLSLLGKAAPAIEAADSRSRFLEAFHNLLNVCSHFYKQADNKFVVADGFPVLNALKEVHLLLAEGAHNQFGDLPWTARVEMLIQMWLLARPEMQEFLGSRSMMPYREGWMGRVDAMRSMQGWGDTSVTHFSDLARFGEQLLLSIRWGNWSDISDSPSAAWWALGWRDAVQGYVHAYRAVTGVDLTRPLQASRVDATIPAVHLRNRLAAGRRAR